MVLDHFWHLDLETVEITIDVEQKLRGDTNEHQAGSQIRKRIIFQLVLEHFWNPDFEIVENALDIEQNCDRTPTVTKLCTKSASRGKLLKEAH